MKVELGTLDSEAVHSLLGGVIIPQPIAFISTVSKIGTYNASPFAFLTPVCMKPPMICISFGLRQGQKKDTVRNIEDTKDFVVNIVDDGLIDQAVKAAASYPSDVDEMKTVGLTAVRSEKVKSPRIAESPVSLECKLSKIMRLGKGPDLRNLVFGEVVLAHVRDDVMVAGSVSPSKLRAIGRVGRNMYCHTADVFERKTPPLSKS